MDEAIDEKLLGSPGLQSLKVPGDRLLKEIQRLEQLRAEAWDTSFINKHRLSKSELLNVAAALNRYGTQSYYYIAMQGRNVKEAAGKADFNSATSVRGLLLMREPGYMEALGDGLYHDGLGNLFEYGQIGKFGGKPARYASSDLANGNRILSLDLDNDGIVDLALASRFDEEKLTRLAALFNEMGQAFLDCYGKTGRSGAGKTSLSTRTGRLSGSGQKDPCAGFDVGGGGDGGGFFGGDGPGGMLLGEPDCGQGGPDIGIAAQGRPPGNSGDWDQDKRNYQREAQNHRERVLLWDQQSGTAARAFADAHRSIARDYDQLAREAEHLERSEQFYEEVLHDPNSSQDDIDAALDILNTEWANLETHRNVVKNFEISVLNIEISYLVRRRSRGGTRQGPGGQPAIGPDGQPEHQAKDPRCEGLKIAAAQGTLFMRFCKLDLITCLLSLEDPLNEMTGGNCRETTGPDDKPTVKCDQGGQEDGEVRPGSPGGPDAGPADAPRRGSRGRRDSGINLIDATPLGPAIAAMCREAGGTGPCGDPRP